MSPVSKNSRAHRPLMRRKRAPLWLIGIVLAWSLAVGLGLARAIAAEPAPQITTVDAIPPRHQAGQQLYLETCATCHIGIPPAVLPTQTWRELLRDPQHYGAELQPLVDPPRYLVWNYLKFASRQVAPEENVPYRIAQSKYFKILHPNIELPQKATLSSCIACHPGTNQFNFRSLSPPWKKAP
ncbi:diheme cytochrome C [Myxacorys almedinensis]|uniref:Diheme cytochrome C n=1 Tax=Myxacorys almedinensis A TaxID=2690445 RepID=A0A8J7Z3C5_9CYAN|nr:diheme cytochrome C [Myxacorys almedinensis]NDJ19244.1 diheme cytochrome C [Myxacorys almedinensis A]